MRLEGVTPGMQRCTHVPQASDGRIADLRNWNEAKLLELKEWLSTMTEGEVEAVQQRIRQYEEARGALRQAA